MQKDASHLMCIRGHILSSQSPRCLVTIGFMSLPGNVYGRLRMWDMSVEMRRRRVNTLVMQTLDINT